MKFDTVQVFSLSYLWSLYVCMSSCLPSSLSYHWSTMLLHHQSHIGCIVSIFLQSEFSNVFSNCLPKQMHSHIGCICTIFLQSEFSNVSSNCLPQQRHSHIGCICMIFLQSDFSVVSLNCSPQQMHSHIGYKFKCLLKLLASKDA